MTGERGFASRTLSAIAEGAIRDEVPTHEPALAETRWAVGRLSDESVERLEVFILDLTRRAPMSSPLWTAHRMVLEGLAADLKRETEARDAERGAP